MGMAVKGEDGDEGEEEKPAGRSSARGTGVAAGFMVSSWCPHGPPMTAPPTAADLDVQARHITASLAAAGEYATFEGVLWNLLDWHGVPSFDQLPGHWAGGGAMAVPTLRHLAMLERRLHTFVTAHLASRPVAALVDLERAAVSMLDSFGIPSLPTISASRNPEEIDIDALDVEASGGGADGSGDGVGGHRHRGPSDDDTLRFTKYGVGPLHRHPALVTFFPNAGFVRLLSDADVLRCLERFVSQGREHKFGPSPAGQTPGGREAWFRGEPAVDVHVATFLEFMMQEEGVNAVGEVGVVAVPPVGGRGLAEECQMLAHVAAERRRFHAEALDSSLRRLQRRENQGQCFGDDGADDEAQQSMEHEQGGVRQSTALESSCGEVSTDETRDKTKGPRRRRRRAQKGHEVVKEKPDQVVQGRGTRQVQSDGEDKGVCDVELATPSRATIQIFLAACRKALEDSLYAPSFTKMRGIVEGLLSATSQDAAAPAQQLPSGKRGKKRRKALGSRLAHQDDEGSVIADPQTHAPRLEVEVLTEYAMLHFGGSKYRARAWRRRSIEEGLAALNEFASSGEGNCEKAADAETFGGNRGVNHAEPLASGARHGEEEGGSEKDADHQEKEEDARREGGEGLEDGGDEGSDQPESAASTSSEVAQSDAVDPCEAQEHDETSEPSGGEEASGAARETVSAQEPEQACGSPTRRPEELPRKQPRRGLEHMGGPLGSTAPSQGHHHLAITTTEEERDGAREAGAGAGHCSGMEAKMRFPVSPGQPWAGRLSRPRLHPHPCTSPIVFNIDVGPASPCMPWPFPPLDSSDSRAVGRWGERLVFQILLQRYPAARGAVVTWLDKDPAAPTRAPYDFKVQHPSAGTLFIEAKTTVASDMNVFDISPQEWSFATERVRGALVQYHVYRVFSAGNANSCRVRVVTDLARAVQEGLSRLCLAV